MPVPGARAISVVGVLLGATLSLSCAPRHAPTAPAVPTVKPVSTSDIEALIARGCYRCLEEALNLSRQRAVSKLAFEAAALLALRANELGMPGQEWLAQARSFASDEASSTTYLDMIAAVPSDPLSGQRGDLLVETQARTRARSMLPMWRELLKTDGASSAFRHYLELTLACSIDVSRERDDDIAKLVGALPDVPLLRYRAGICNARLRRDNVAMLTSVRQDDAGFVDADYPLGKYAMSDPETPDQEEAMRLFQLAAVAFPSSAAIAVSIGNLYQSWEEWKNALGAYDTALALMPSHPDALLGRTISLSNLQQHQEAIATATRLIEGGQWFLGQAFYWRAWNRYNLGDNAAARVDADRTRMLMVNSSVFLLSGLIEWKAPRLPSAETEFEQSVAMDFGQCLAALYLGGVRVEQSKVPQAIAALQQAHQCYDLSIAVHRASIEKINAGRGTPVTKARSVAREERLIADDERRREQAIKTGDALKERQRQPSVQRSR
ncbi:MAG TPA: hypothetical protein VKB50_04380 [Vicinamibacterales bacterium]|nr:hypothetical protein [Vicinamibacterales bacterium]